LHPAKKEFTKNLFVDSLTSFGGKFILDGKMYMFGYQFIYTNEDFENNPYNWTKDSTSKEFAKGGSSYWTNDFAYLVTFNYQGLDNINFLKITPFKPTTYKENEVIPTQFWAYPPYPQPANKFVKSIIYWDQHFDIKDAMISIYNLMGNKI
jgi:hypothetical protein